MAGRRWDSGGISRILSGSRLNSAPSAFIIQHSSFIIFQKQLPVANFSLLHHSMGRMSKCFYVTTAIDYVNGQPHLGHAYEKVIADVAGPRPALPGRTGFLPDRPGRARPEGPASRAGGRQKSAGVLRRPGGDVAAVRPKTRPFQRRFRPHHRSAPQTGRPGHFVPPARGRTVLQEDATRAFTPPPPKHF